MPQDNTTPAHPERQAWIDKARPAYARFKGAEDELEAASAALTKILNDAGEAGFSLYRREIAPMNQSAEPHTYADGYKGTQQQLLNALRHTGKFDNETGRIVRSAAAEEIERQRDAIASYHRAINGDLS